MQAILIAEWRTFNRHDSGGKSPSGNRSTAKRSRLGRPGLRPVQPGGLIGRCRPGVSPHLGGYADYLLFIDWEAVGAVEAKPEGTTLSGVEEQTGGYLSSLPEEIPHSASPLPFGYESTGKETFFVDSRESTPRSRRVFAFHRPESLRDYLGQERMLRERLGELPDLAAGNLRECQFEAIANLER